MARYVTAGYWVRGYAEGDYTYAAASSDATSAVDAGANIIVSMAAESGGLSATIASPYRIKFVGFKSDGASDVDLGINRYRLFGVLPAGSSIGKASLSRTITVSGGKVFADGDMGFSARLKWENEPEPGDAWEDRDEPIGIWADRAEPGDTWTDRSEPSGIWTDRPEPGDSWSDA